MISEPQLPSMTHDEMLAQWMKDPEFRAEHERVEREEFVLLDEMLAARRAAGLTQVAP